MNCHIRIGSFEGRGHISRLIQKQTDHNKSHSCAILRDGSIVEACHKVGVDHVHKRGLDLQEYDTIKCLSKNHNSGTPVDILGIESTEEQAEVFERFLLEQEGEAYDFWAIFRFLTRKPYAENNKWFCSELIAHGLIKAGIHIQERIPSYKMSPKLVDISPLLIPIQTVVTI